MGITGLLYVVVKCRSTLKMQILQRIGGLFLHNIRKYVQSQFRNSFVFSLDIELSLVWSTHPPLFQHRDLLPGDLAILGHCFDQGRTVEIWTWPRPEIVNVMKEER